MCPNIILCMSKRADPDQIPPSVMSDLGIFRVRPLCASIYANWVHSPDFLPSFIYLWSMLNIVYIILFDINTVDSRYLEFLGTL